MNNRYAETGYEFPASWVDAHIERLGGWRLAPASLVRQLAEVSSAQLEARRNPASLSLTPRRQRRHLNAQLLFLGSPMDVLLNPVDAAAVGVQDGEQVVVRSGRGEIVGVARVDESVRRGVVSVPHGHEHANVNYLTDIRKLDPLTGMALYSGFPVTVRPVSDRSSPAGNQAR